MNNVPKLSRRQLLQTSAVVTGLAMLDVPMPVRAVALQQGEEVIPWLDQRGENPLPDVLSEQLEWENLDSWITPNDEFFSVSHYGVPEVDAANWQLEITGMVQHPMTLTLDDLKEWPRQELTYTLECSGNHGFDWFTGGIGNARWAGVSLAAILGEADMLDDGIEVIFYGADAGEVTVREQTFTQNFARSLSIEDAMSPYNLLCYEMNGEDLPADHGAPLRLIIPGWYGVANVKWLTRIEVSDTRLMNLYMARDYVTLRQEERDGETVWTETSVGRANLKSAPARVVSTGDGYRIEGAAWGAPVASVEVQIDDGEWMEAELDSENVRRFAWRFWSVEWPDAAPGEHAVTSRATDVYGDVQPAMDDPIITGKMTYWESNGQITRLVEIPA